ADKGSGVRSEAAQSLGAMRDPAAIEHLLNALGDDSEEVRQAASRAVGEIRAAEDPLIPTDAMLSGSPVERAAARKRASVLRRVKRTRRRVDTEEIMRSLDDNDRDVRAEAALALGRVGETAALDRLSRLLNDPDSGVRREAAQALGMIGDERALEPLLEAIGGNAEEVRHAAAKALGQVGGDASKSLLRDIVKSSGRVDGVTATSAEAVSRFGNVAALMEIYPRMHQTDNPVLRNQLAIASGNLLGRPGEFYDILSQLRAGRHEVWDKLVRLSQRNVRQWADYAVREHGLDAREVETQKRQMLKRLTALAKQVEGEKWPAAIKTLRRTVGRVATFVFGDMAGAMLGDAAYLANPRYAMGLWFTSQVEQRLPQAGAGSADDQLLMTDCLLSLYFLSRFRPEQDLS
ncbi:MAG: HEAT repeat domain-containing protein, partial [Planctomycetia bacterium]|nr:HEAT repeat domain-containing protein [Planctomycetia bacterium]